MSNYANDQLNETGIPQRGIFKSLGNLKNSNVAPKRNQSMLDKTHSSISNQIVTAEKT